MGNILNTIFPYGRKKLKKILQISLEPANFILQCQRISSTGDLYDKFVFHFLSFSFFSHDKSPEGNILQLVWRSPCEMPKVHPKQHTIFSPSLLFHFNIWFLLDLISWRITGLIIFNIYIYMRYIQWNDTNQTIDIYAVVRTTKGFTNIII